MFASVALLLLSALLLLLLFQNRRPKNFPPGPPAIPFIGNVLEIQLGNPLPDLKRLTKQYGNIYSLFFGGRPVVILNGLEAVKEALVTKAADFSGRAKDLLYTRVLVTQEHAPGVIFADYSPGWKEQRRFGLMTLRNLGLGKQSMEKKILGETLHLSKILEDSIGKSLTPHRMFHNAASNVVCQLLFAKRFDYDDEFLKFSVDLFNEVSKLVNGRWGMLYDFVPMVRKLPLPFQRVFKLLRESRARYSQIVAESKKTRVPGKPRHFIDCYLDEMDKRGDDSLLFSEDQLCAYILDLHFAGTDTTANTVLTGFLYLMNYPHIQERCQQEIDQVLDGKDQITFEDRHQMPYVQAVLHEIQRVSDIGPLGVFHCTTKDTELMGYSIPKRTIVIPNLSSLLFEEGRWKSPRQFDPENFLNDQGEFVKPDAFLPFSAGPRICLGESLARIDLFLVMVTLLRKFTFIWPEDGGEPDYTPVFGTIQAAKPFSMKVQLRTTV